MTDWIAKQRKVVNGAASQVDIHPITVDWTETGVTWANSNANYDASKKVSSTPPMTANIDTNFDIKTLVQDMVNGVYPNFGFMIKQGDEIKPSINRTFCTKENETVAYRPTLTIDYSIPTTGKKQVELLGNASNNQTNESPVHIPSFPAGYQAQVGDLALIHVITKDYTVTPTNGWQIIRQAVAPSGHRYILAYKFLVASEVASAALSSSSSSDWHSKTLILRNVKAIKESSSRGIASQTAYYPFDVGTFQNTER